MKLSSYFLESLRAYPEKEYFYNSNNGMLSFHPRYFLLTCVFLFLEIMIAVFVKDNFVRPYLGDVLVVVLLYCIFRAFFRIGVNKSIVIVVGFAFLVEFSQYLHLIRILGLEDSSLARAVLGNSFSGADIVMYILGGVTVMVFEYLRDIKKAKTSGPVQSEKRK